MRDDGFVTEKEALKAISTPIKLANRSPDNVVKADFFAEAVRQNIAQIYGEKSLYEGGLMVRTSLDPWLMNIAEKSLRNGLIRYDKRHGYRGAIGKIKLNEDFSKQLSEVNPYGFDIKPWRYAMILERNDAVIKIGFSDKSTANVNIAGSQWALGGKKITKVFMPGDIIIVDEKNALAQVPKVNGALVAMDPHTGRVLALVGGYSFDSSKFNRVTQAYRQPGSSFKTFVYLAALENNYAPTTIFQDAPIELEQGPGLPLWKPKNFYNDFQGDMTLRRGLEFSRNPITVRVAQAIGINKVAEIARRFGISSDPKPYYSMVLGAMETTLLRMTNAYAVIANGGRKVTPSLIDKIQDRNGRLIYSNDQRTCVDCMDQDAKTPFIQDNRPFVTDPRSAYQITSMLEGVIQHTKTSATTRELGYTLAGKTGTTNDAKDVWFIGFSSNLVVGVFVGYDEPKSLGKHESGAMVAQPIFVDFMKAALSGKVSRPFTVPAGIKLVKVNYLTGEPTTSQKDSIYEAFKNKDYVVPKPETIRSYIETGAEPKESIATKAEPFDLDEIQDEGIY